MLLQGTRGRAVALLFAVALGVGVSASGASAKSSRATAGITVYAAASLTDVFPKIDPTATYSFAGSNALATQITNGAPADVFASANTTLPAQLYAAGTVEKPVTFTRNTLVAIVPKANPPTSRASTTSRSRASRSTSRTRPFRSAPTRSRSGSRWA